MDADREFAQQLLSLSRHRRPLPEGLRAIASDTPSSRLQRQYRLVASRLESGMSLSEALESIGSPELAACATLYESAGSADTQLQVLSIWNRQLQFARQLVHQFRAALWYPLIVAAIGLVTSAWLSSMLAQIVTVFREWEWGIADLPWLARAALSVSGTGPWLFPVVVLSTLLVLAVAALAMPASIRHRITARLPLVGSLSRWLLWSAYLQTLAALVEARLPLLEATQALAWRFQGSALSVAAQRISERVAEGATLHEACRGVRQFPRELVPLTKTATSADATFRSLNAMSGVCYERFQILARFARCVIPLVVVVLVAWLVAFQLAALGSVMMSFVTGLAS